MTITMEELQKMPIADLHDITDDMLEEMNKAAYAMTGSMNDIIYLRELVRRLLERSKQLSDIKKATSIKTIVTVLEDVDG